MSKYNLSEILTESFDSLAKKIDKQKGKDKDDAANIAGYIANIKRKGGGSGPTAKQKARMKEEVDELDDTVRKSLEDLVGVLQGMDMDRKGEFVSSLRFVLKYGFVDESKKTGINEITSDERKRIDDLINQKFKGEFLTKFGEMYADLTQDDKFESEDVIEYLEEEMRVMLKEKGLYDDGMMDEAIDDLPDEIKKREQEKIERDARKMEEGHHEKKEKIKEDLFKRDGDTEDNVDNIDTVASPSAKGKGYNQVSKANTDEDDMESKEIANPEPMFEDLKRHFKRFL